MNATSKVPYRVKRNSWVLTKRKSWCDSALRADERMRGGRTTIHALYAGSFDPPSVGHQDIIRRALASLCHKLTVAVAINPAKRCLFTIDERQHMLCKITEDLGDVDVRAFDGLLVDFARANNINLLVRGIRAYSDLEGELRMALINRRLTGIETAFLLADNKFGHVSSSLIREVRPLACAAASAPANLSFATRRVALRCPVPPRSSLTSARFSPISCRT